MIKHFIPILVLATCFACAAPRPPVLPYAVESRFGVVHAEEQIDASEISAIVERIAPEVAKMLPDRDDLPIDVRLVRKLRQAHWGGATYKYGKSRWIELPAKGRDEKARSALAHELVHFWLGPGWDTLPPVLEEGVANVVSHAVVPEAAALERAEFAVMLATATDGGLTFTNPVTLPGATPMLTVRRDATYKLYAEIEREMLPTFDQAMSISSKALTSTGSRGALGVRAVLDALSYVVVQRIGIDELHVLCQRAAVQRLTLVPSQWIWAAAGLDPNDSAQFTRAAHDLLGPEEIQALLRTRKVEWTTHLDTHGGGAPGDQGG